MFAHDALAGWIIRYLTKELPGYQRRVPNDMDQLAGHLQPGDVVLVEGKSRISQVIMYLTQSSWSHAAMYIGDTLMRWGGPHADAALARFGTEATQLIIESDMKEGVRVMPLSFYQRNNLRICRPHGLLPQDREEVLTVMLRHLGVQYDKRNIFDLARYLTPFHLLPAKFRRRPLYFGSSSSREVICSALIAKAFYKVNYPIQSVTRVGPSGEAEGGRKGKILMRHPSYIMPRDFDLSANFEVLKINLMSSQRFVYREPAWR